MPRAILSTPSNKKIVFIFLMWLLLHEVIESPDFQACDCVNSEKQFTPTIGIEMEFGFGGLTYCHISPSIEKSFSILLQTHDIILVCLYNITIWRSGILFVLWPRSDEFFFVHCIEEKEYNWEWHSNEGGPRGGMGESTLCHIHRYLRIARRTQFLFYEHRAKQNGSKNTFQQLTQLSFTACRLYIAFLFCGDIVFVCV